MYKMFIVVSTLALLAGTNEKAIISVVAYRSNAQRQQIKEKFKSIYGKVSQIELSSCTQLLASHLSVSTLKALQRLITLFQ